MNDSCVEVRGNFLWGDEMINRVFLIVLDSVGIGGAADAKNFGDDNPNTLKSIAASKNFDTPNLKRLGLFNIDGMQCVMRNAQCVMPIGSFARVCEASAGKDTTIGHWVRLVQC